PVALWFRWLGYGVVPSVGSFQPALTAIDPISMTPSILRQSTGFDDPGGVYGGHPSVARHISISFDRLRSQSILFR
ncbi:hypothetical protein V8C86DRAFT_2969515, partial [Haematococcus lacustris]